MTLAAGTASNINVRTFALTASPEEVREILSLMELEDFPARYNIAPTQPILAVVAGPPTEPGSNRPDRLPFSSAGG